MTSMALDWNPLPYRQSFLSHHGIIFHSIAWTPTTADSWKVNVAGFIDDSRVAGISCVVRDQNAVFRSAASAPVTDYLCPLEIELAALNLGMYDAMLQGIEYLEIEGQSEVAMRVLLGQINPPLLSDEAILNQCALLLQEFRLLKFHPVYAYANRAATHLAEMAIHQRELVRWSREVPSIYKRILKKPLIKFSTVIAGETAARFLEAVRKGKLNQTCSGI